MPTGSLEKRPFNEGKMKYYSTFFKYFNCMVVIIRMKWLMIISAFTISAAFLNILFLVCNRMSY